MASKDHIIAHQQYTISSLAEESERLRLDRDKLVIILKGLRRSEAPHSAKLRVNHGASWDSGLDSQVVYSNQCYPWTRSRPATVAAPRNGEVLVGNSSLNNRYHNASLYPTGWNELSTTANNSNGQHQVYEQQVIGSGSTSIRPPHLVDRHRSFKRGHEENRTDQQSYELSNDLRTKQIEMLERKYGGGPLRSQAAAEIIQYNYRQYALSKNFERLRSNKDKTRVSRMLSDVSTDRDSVWSDVTITPASYNTPTAYNSPISHTYTDHSFSASPSSCVNDRAFLTTPTVSQLDLSDFNGSEGYSDDSFSSNRAVANAADLTHRKLSRLNHTVPNDRLHMTDVQHRTAKSDLDPNFNLLGPNSPNSFSDTDSAHASPIGGEASISSGESVETSDGSDTISYARNLSVNESRLDDVHVKFHRVSEKERKRQYKIGLNLFNCKPEKGIKYFMEQRFLDNSSRAVAKFLLQRKGLSKQMIGEYLGNLQSDFNQDVLLCVVQELNLSSMGIDEGLRKLIFHCRLPGEAQKIERIIERFAQRYCICNPDIASQFQTADSVFLVAFAIIMLNTDLHNPNIKASRKMKLEAFIKNLKGIDNGSDIPEDMLIGIYERIQAQELKTGPDHTAQVRKVEETLIGKAPQLVASHRRLVCYCRLYEVPDLLRKERVGSHQREVFLFNDMLLITKIFTKKKSNMTYSFRQSILLSDITVHSFTNENYPYGILIVSKLERKEIIHFNARNQHDKDNFLQDLSESIAEINAINTMRITEEIRKQSLTDSNRLSKDSGVIDVELHSRPVTSNSRPLTSNSLSIPGDTQHTSQINDSDFQALSIVCDDSLKRHSNGSVDSGMMSNSTGSASREESPHLHQRSKHNHSISLTPRPRGQPTHLSNLGIF